MMALIEEVAILTQTRIKDVQIVLETMARCSQSRMNRFVQLNALENYIEGTGFLTGRSACQGWQSSLWTELPWM